MGYSKRLKPEEAKHFGLIYLCKLIGLLNLVFVN